MTRNSPARERAISLGNARPTSSSTPAPNSQLRGFQLQTAEEPAVARRERGRFNASAKGQTNFDAATRIDAAALTSRAAPIRSRRRSWSRSRICRAAACGRSGPAIGQLQNWPARLAVWLPTMNNYQLTGNYIVEGDGVASKDGGECVRCGFAAEPLVVKSPLLNVNETRIEGTAAGSWNGQQRRLQIPAATISCAPRPSAAKDIVMALPAGGATELTGTVNYQGDAGRIRQWFADPKLPSPGDLPGNSRARPHCSKPPASCTA